MNNYFILTLCIFFASCSARNEEKKTVIESHGNSTSNHSNSEYVFIRDNLYADNKGNLYLKAHQEDFGNGTVAWLSYVYVDNYNKNTRTNNKDLKDVVDTATFHLSRTDNKNGVDIYEDKKYRYFHKWMADGGTITLDEK